MEYLRIVSKGLETLKNIRNSIDLGQKVRLIDRSNRPVTSRRKWIFVIEHKIWWRHMFCRTLRLWWRPSSVFGSQCEHRHYSSLYVALFVPRFPVALPVGAEGSQCTSDYTDTIPTLTSNIKISRWEDAFPLWAIHPLITRIILHQQ